jgi:mannose-1-phosphate guanylyltransferase
MLILPSDHVITDVNEFHAVLKQAEALAKANWLVTFGVRPRYAATGYGYVEIGTRLEGVDATLKAYEVARFTEKPDRETAEGFLASGRFFWNSGMFAWLVDTILEEIAVNMPSLSEGLLALDGNGDEAHLAEEFAKLDPISIDYGVMEKSHRVATIPCDLGWNDVGTWKSVRDLQQVEEGQTVANCPVETVNSRDCLVHSTGKKLVALVGVEDLVVVETEDSLLVCCVERAEDVGKVVRRLREQKKDEYL